MRKLLMLSAVTMLSLNVVHAQSHVALEAGIYQSDMTYKSNSGNVLTTDSKFSPKVGIVEEFKINKFLFLQAGLNYHQSGVKASETITYLNQSTQSDFDIKLNYIELPVNLGYRYSLGKKGSLFATAGPYLSYGFKGKSTNETIVNGGAPLDSEHDIAFGKKTTDNMKRFDYGANFGIGYLSPFGFYIRAQYGLGLKDLSGPTTTTIKNKGLSAMIGFRL